jgi:hypothetical protein
MVQQDYLNLRKVDKTKNKKKRFLWILFQIFLAIENLRLEREHIVKSSSGKKQRHRISPTQQKSIESPVRSLEQDT